MGQVGREVAERFVWLLWCVEVRSVSEEASTDLDSEAQVVEPHYAAQRDCVCGGSIQFLCKFDDLESNPVSGYQKPTATPRVTAFTPKEETAILEAADEAHGRFIKARLLAGALPYSELANVTADHVVETPHGMHYLLKA